MPQGGKSCDGFNDLCSLLLNRYIPGVMITYELNPLNNLTQEKGYSYVETKKSVIHCISWSVFDLLWDSFGRGRICFAVQWEGFERVESHWNAGCFCGEESFHLHDRSEPLSVVLCSDAQYENFVLRFEHMTDTSAFRTLAARPIFETSKSAHSQARNDGQICSPRVWMGCDWSKKPIGA